MHHYEYISNTDPRVRAAWSDLQEILRQLHETLREYFTFQHKIIGSYKRKMVTWEPKGNKGFDFDVNLEIQRVFQDNLSPKAFKNMIKKALDGIVAATDYDFTEDSTRVLTIKVKDRENARILYSVDFAITRVSEDEDGDEFEEFIRFNKKRDSYQWCRQEERYYRLKEKAKWLKENELWQELRDYYLKKKNENENPQLHSRSIYDIAVHEMCQKNGYFEQEAPRANAGALTTEPIQQHREIQSSYSLYGQNAAYGIHPTFKAVKCTDLLYGNALNCRTE